LEFIHPITKQLCAIDATEDNPAFGFGRYINHHRQKPNAAWRTVMSNGEVRVAVVALQKIQRGDEILLDYFRFARWTPQELINNPWLKSELPAEQEEE
jgi:SET domain-containing protein